MRMRNKGFDKWKKEKISWSHQMKSGIAGRNRRARAAAVAASEAEEKLLS